jgi:alpha-tubulin suppressor-like RCC1 family protein
MKRVAFLTVCLTSLLAASASAQVKHWGGYGEPIPLVPTEVQGLENVTRIDAGNGSGYALESNATEWAWGENSEGELGNGTKAASYNGAVKVSFPKGVRIVAIGEARYDGFAIDSTGQGWAWGEGAKGVLCTGDGQKKVKSPVRVPGITSAVAVQGGENHVLWLMADGTVRACGENWNGQLGVGASVPETNVPLEVPGLSEVVEISAGERHSLARTASGKVYAWGDNKHGQVCIGLKVPAVYLPSEVVLPGPASDISGGGDLTRNGHTMMLVGGVPYGCGDDEEGQVGDGKLVNKYSPTLATRLARVPLTQVVALGEASAGLSAAGVVYTSGSGEWGTLGNGSEASSLDPVEADSKVLEISGTAGNVIDRG